MWVSSNSQRKRYGTEVNLRQGRNNHLVVAMRSYDPHVVCGPQVGKVPLTGSCQPAQLKLPVDVSPVQFGHLSRQVRTPRKIALRKYRNSESHSRFRAFQWLILKQLTSMFAAGYPCEIIIDTTTGLDIASWFDVWQGLVAVNVLCLMQGQAGMSIQIGKFTPEP